MKANADVLCELQNKLVAERDKYSEMFSELFGVVSTIQSHWQDEQYGNFYTVMMRVQECKFLVEDDIGSVIDELSEIVDLVHQYEKK